MRQKAAAEVHHQKVAELGLDPGRFYLTSTEAIAGAVRRAAGFLCPCTASSLVRAVVTPLRGLSDDLSALKVAVTDILEAMISHGDVLEYREFDAGTSGERTLLFAAPAAFVPWDTGKYVLVGISGDHFSALPRDLIVRIDHVGHTRRLNALGGEDLRDRLLAHGLLELDHDAWLKAPRFTKPAQLLSAYNDLLDSAHPSGDVPGLQILDPELPVRYYRGRWVPAHRRSGRFVARRDQAYGARLWCYVHMEDGNPEALIDLPLPKSRWRGYDEAWHLQMAIDASRGEPQQFAVRVDSEDTRIIAFFSPVPMWARRRWDAIGEPLSSGGCLFAYRITKDDLPKELAFIRRVLWLSEG